VTAAPESSGAPDAALTVEDLRVQFHTAAGVARAVDGAAWSVARGETLALAGESGSGKSVSALAVMGLLPTPPACAVTGQVRLGDRDLLRCTNDELRQLRGPAISMIFQDPATSLNPVFTVGDQITEVIRAHEPVTRSAARRRAVDLLGDVGLPEPHFRAGEYPHQLSGGMQQRAMIAIALALDPTVLLADEPTTAVDVTVQAQILELLARLQAERGTAIVLITHDLSVAAAFADRIVVMYAGRVAESGDAHDVLHRPRHAYTWCLLASLPGQDQGGTRLPSIPGQPPSALDPVPGCPFHPRCPLASDVCRVESPVLVAPEGGRHFSACHHRDRLGSRPRPVAVGAEGSVPRQDGEESPLVVEVQGLVKYYSVGAGPFAGRRSRRVQAVDGVSFALARGETLALVGESGSGKTTVARCVLRLVEPTSGRVRFNGEDVTDARPGRVRALRRQMQIVFQDAYGSLDPRMTVKAALEEPFRIHKAYDDGRVLDLLEAVGLSAEHGARYPHELSSGQRQRVGIARAVALDPQLVVCDEAVSALDVSLQAQILNLLADLQDTRHLAYLFIAHDLRVVRRLAHRVAVMYRGVIVETAGADQIFEHPRHPYTQVLLAASPVASRPPSRPRAGPPPPDPVPGAFDVAGGCRFRTRCPRFAAELTVEERQRCIDEAPELAERGTSGLAACHYAEERPVP
jgi:peptide/nickel transport system ATP-binding protein